jgi:kynurenine formamidase
MSADTVSSARLNTHKFYILLMEYAFISYGSQKECWSFTCTPLKIKEGKGHPVRVSGGTEGE